MEKSKNNEVQDTLKEEVQSAEQEIINKQMRAYEFDYIRKRAGLSFADIGRAAMYLGLRDKPYDRSTISKWIGYYNEIMTIKAVKMLSYYLTKEQFIELRKEWIDQQK